MYTEYEKVVNEKIKEKEEQIENLENVYNTLSNSKVFLKRNKELKAKYLEHIKDSILKIKNEIFVLKESLSNPEEISSILDLDLDLDVSDAKALKKNEYFNESKRIETISDIALVHKTKFLPIDGVMYTARETKATRTSKMKVDGVEYEYKFEVGNDTLHFTMNGPVSDHYYGSWEDCPYGIILPFDKVDKSNMLRIHPEDTYFQNHIDLTEGSIIICPKEEKEKVKKQNPNVKVIGYDSSINLDTKSDTPLDIAIECVLIYKGYKVKSISNNGWADLQGNWNIDPDYIKLNEIKKENDLKDKEVEHAESKNLVRSQLYALSKRIIAISKTIIDNNLIQSENIELGSAAIDSLFEDDMKYFFKVFKEDLKNSKLHILESTVDDDFEFAYEFAEGYKNPGGKCYNYNVTNMLQEYFVTILLGYEKVKRMSMNEIEKEEMALGK